MLTELPIDRPTHPSADASTDLPTLDLPHRPTLPEPTLARWQPLRLGLVELFHYDSEEFWFRDGHLLLRGNNGTGKSKVLSLTLPFLFDAQLKSSRIEPDGDPGKKMAWNLLLGRHDRRMGYAWIEFGRVGDDGAAQYLTLGCGLNAAAARPQVDSWFFVLEQQRIGHDLWLTSPQRVVLTRERLKDALQSHGQVFETATAYRRAVDERLFHLGEARYAALMDTLIQLRQPQLSKKPDEGSLSDALTEALPPMPTGLLTDVAEALNQLEEDRRELAEYEALAKAIGQFNGHYRRYAATQARRQAGTLRSAQSGFDKASRSLNESRAALDMARQAEANAQTHRNEAEAALAASRNRLEELQADPANADANRLATAEADAGNRQQEAVVAERQVDDTRLKLGRETATTRQRMQRASQAGTTLAETREAAAGFAQTSGLDDSYRHNPIAAAEPAALADLEALTFDTARNDLKRVADARREQLAQMKRRRTELDDAERQHGHQQSLRDQRNDEAEQAAAHRALADAAVEQQGQALLTAWQNHLDGLQQLRIADTRAALDALAIWVAELQGGNPARVALQSAQQLASQRLAQRQAALLAERKLLQAQQDDWLAERQRLEHGEDAMPPAQQHRAAGARATRAGAPLWQLVDFQPHVDASQRAGLEAALEASGLLDAWVSPDGRLQSAEGGEPLDDTSWVTRPAQAASLAAWLVADGSGSASVPAGVMARLLEGVACSATDDESAEAWLAPDGRFRLGALSGHWQKPAAAYIGYAARAAARARRLEALAALLTEAESALHRVGEQLAEHDRHQQQAKVEWQDAPGDEELRTAHANAAARGREFQAARTRLLQTDQQLQQAAQQRQRAREALSADAQDLHLPDTHATLQLVADALARFNETVPSLVHAVRELRQAQAELYAQREREQEAGADLALRSGHSAEARARAEEASVRFETLRDNIGLQVDELMRRLQAARSQVKADDKADKDSVSALGLAGEARAVARQQTLADEATLGERIATRQQAIINLQGFSATGLMAMALPDAELPELRTPWTIDPALGLARRAEQSLGQVPDDDEAWRRIQSQIGHDFTDLGRALTALAHQAQAEPSEYGLIVTIVYQNRPERPDQLTTRLEGEIAERRALLTAHEREVLENHLQAEIASAVQKLLQAADAQVIAINKELHKRPTSTGVKFRLLWQPLPEGAEGAPVGLEAARQRLLNTGEDLWSAEDRRVVGAMLHARITAERLRADAAGGGSLLDQLSRALDYRRWHRFRVQRWQDGQWRPLSGPASSGERALGLTVPLFAAVSSYYSQGSYAHAPRLVLLDEAFAGIDDAARAHCMGLIREFDLDFVITSEREWGCYAELPGVSICQLQRREGVDAVHVSRWTWDGLARRRDDDPDRRFGAAEKLE